jgi:hypothetical protein
MKRSDGIMIYFLALDTPIIPIESSGIPTTITVAKYE